MHASYSTITLASWQESWNILREIHTRKGFLFHWLNILRDFWLCIYEAADSRTFVSWLYKHFHFRCNLVGMQMKNCTLSVLRSKWEKYTWNLLAKHFCWVINCLTVHNCHKRSYLNFFRSNDICFQLLGFVWHLSRYIFIITTIWSVQTEHSHKHRHCSTLNMKKKTIQLQNFEFMLRTISQQVYFPKYTKRKPLYDLNCCVESKTLNGFCNTNETDTLRQNSPRRQTLYLHSKVNTFMISHYNIKFPNIIINKIIKECADAVILPNEPILNSWLEKPMTMSDKDFKSEISNSFLRIS